eukprot:761941-Hanusia_phi.AAC.3
MQNPRLRSISSPRTPPSGSVCGQRETGTRLLTGLVVLNVEQGSASHCRTERDDSRGGRDAV